MAELSNRFTDPVCRDPSRAQTHGEARSLPQLNDPQVQDIADADHADKLLSFFDRYMADIAHEHRSTSRGQYHLGVFVMSAETRVAS